MADSIDVPTDEYLDTAQAALEYLFVPVYDGGALSYLRDGHVWFEEYPCDRGPATVLNGHLFVLDVLDLFADSTGVQKYQDWFLRGANAVVAHAEDFDTGYGSLYDQLRRVDKLGSHYHRLHWEQLSWLYVRTGVEELSTLARTWFEQEQQSDYDVTASSSIDPVYHGASILNDGAYWYGYWSAIGSATIEASFPRQELVGVNLFCYAAKEPDSISIEYFDQSTDSWQAANVHAYRDDRLLATPPARSIIGYRLQDPVFTGAVRLVLEGDEVGKIIALREIGLHRANRAGYDAALESRTESGRWDRRTTRYNL